MITKNNEGKNYRLLCEYLKENNIKLLPHEFTGTLIALENMTLFGDNKAKAIETSSLMFKASKRKLNKIIVGMGVTTERKL